MSMSPFSAMSTAVSGMAAQSTNLGAISNNLANASTVGYKQEVTDFESLVDNGGASGATILDGVRTINTMDIASAGQLQSTGVGTDMAINGQGFMIVNTSADGSGSELLTRAGSFRQDANGDLVNAAGYYLQGQAVPLNGAGVPSAAASMSALTTVNVANLTSAGSPTTTMTFMANLPASETAYSTTTPAASTSTMTYYDALGAAQSLQFQFTPTMAASGSAATNTWTMNIYDSASTTPTTPVGSATMVFNGTGTNAGTLSSVTPIGGAGVYDGVAGTFSITTASGTTIPIDIGALNSAKGMSQFTGSYQTTQTAQDGSGFGTLQGISIGATGLVTASFSNGATHAIYQIDLATVPNPDGLLPVNGDAFSLSGTSGAARLAIPGEGNAGTVNAGSLEGSNVDMTTQLTDMIATQRAYSSDAMVVQTAAQMLDTLTHIQA